MIWQLMTNDGCDGRQVQCVQEGVGYWGFEGKPLVKAIEINMDAVQKMGAGQFVAPVGWCGSQSRSSVVVLRLRGVSLDQRDGQACVCEWVV